MDIFVEYVIYQGAWEGGAGHSQDFQHHQNKSLKNVSNVFVLYLNTPKPSLLTSGITAILTISEMFVLGISTLAFSEVS